MKRIVTQNLQDQYGRFLGQMVGVWDTERKCMVYPFDWRKDAKKRAQAFIDQQEFPL